MMRHECSNCKFFITEVADGEGRQLDRLGCCTRPTKPLARVEADDWCNQYVMAKWAKAVKDEEEK